MTAGSRIAPIPADVRPAVGTEGDRPVDPVLMIVHSYYDEDPRVRRQAETLVAAGRPVHVIALRRSGDQPEGVVDGVAVTRLDVQRHQGAGIGTYLREYLGFAARAAMRALRAYRRHRYALVHVHSLPDFLVVAALPLRVLGVPVILDLHEAMPEFFRMRFPRAASPLAYRVLRLQERASIASASMTVTVNAAMRDRLLSLGVPSARLAVVPNSPALARFDASALPARHFMADGRLRLVYAGALTPIYELDVAIAALARLVTDRPDLDAMLELYGRGDDTERLASLAARAGVAERVIFHGRIPIPDVPAAVAASDIGLAPTRLDDFTALTMSTKILEYAAMGKPVVATRLPMVERTFPQGTLWIYPSGDAAAMAREIAAIADGPADRVARAARTLEIVRATAWEQEIPRYLALIDGVIRSVGSGRRQAAPSRR